MSWTSLSIAAAVVLLAACGGHRATDEDEGAGVTTGGDPAGPLAPGRGGDEVVTDSAGGGGASSEDPVDEGSSGGAAGGLVSGGGVGVGGSPAGGEAGGATPASGGVSGSGGSSGGAVVAGGGSAGGEDPVPETGGNGGQAPSDPSLAVLYFYPSRSPLEVGEAAVGKTGSTTTYVEVYSIGDAPTGPLTVSTSDPQFVVVVDTCSGTSLVAASAPEALEGGASCRIGLVLQPTQEGIIDGVLTVGDGGAEISTGLTGIGTPFCLLTATPESLDFGSAPVGYTTSQIVTLTNTGDTSSGILTVSLVNHSRYWISEDACGGVSLDPGASCTITVGYEAFPMESRGIEIVVTPEVGAPLAIPLDGWGVV